jgi:hypothetical protein
MADVTISFTIKEAYVPIMVAAISRYHHRMAQEEDGKSETDKEFLTRVCIDTLHNAYHKHLRRAVQTDVPVDLFGVTP